MARRIGTGEGIARRTMRRRREVNPSAKGLQIGLVTSADSISVRLRGVQDDAVTLHPHIGKNHWDRSVPEVGQLVLWDFDKVTNRPEVLKYLAEDEYEKFNKYYENGDGIYRNLYSGEFERVSKGLAYTKWSRRPTLEYGAGVVISRDDSDELESYKKAPIHRRALHRNKTYEQKDEERVGVVVRYFKETVGLNSTWSSKYVELPAPTSYLYSLSSLASDDVKTDNMFAKEYYLNIQSWEDKDLIDFRHGNVIDEAGDILNHSVTSKPLRSLSKFYTDSSFTSVEIDESGSYAITLAEEASILNMELKNAGMSVTMKGKYLLTSEDDIISRSSKSFQVSATTDVILNAEEIMSVAAQKIKLGGDKPIVYGDELMKFLAELLTQLAGHTHGLAPDPAIAAYVTKATPNLPNLLSKTVTTQ